MNIAIIGGGITGLTAAHEFLKHGHKVTVIERESYLGGLAYGFKESNWQWHLEGAYHHLFTNDAAILALAKELGIADSLITRRPITANLLPPNMPNKTAQLDGPIGLLRFPGLSLLDKIRTGALVAFCKVYPFWKTLEHTTAEEFFKHWGGHRAWKSIWEPLMIGKFGDLSGTVAASWLWARIYKRTPSLIYFSGGFQTLVTALEQSINAHGGLIHKASAVTSIKKTAKGYTLLWTTTGKTTIEHTEQFDTVLFTTPTPIAQKILSTSKLISEKTTLSGAIPHLHAQVMILETTTPILTDTYWLSVTDRSYPFLAVVAHTNFMDKKHYGNNHITYVGNYLPHNHRYITMTKEELLKEFMPYLKRICPTFSGKQIKQSFLFTAPYAQPVHQLEYSKKAPTLITPVANVFLANMDSIYPWDRGTNYAVELGKTAAQTILSSRP